VYCNKRTSSGWVPTEKNLDKDSSKRMGLLEGPSCQAPTTFSIGGKGEKGPSLNGSKKTPVESGGEEKPKKNLRIEKALQGSFHVIEGL